MEWTDSGYVVGVRRHGESSVILEAMTRGHGRHLGLVRAARSRALQPVLQPGNAVQLVWRARIDGHLGHFAVEGLALHAAHFLSSRLALFAMSHVAALVRLLPEREPHPGLHGALGEIIAVISDAGVAPALIARFELEILTELGFGLDLGRCAATGSADDLAYVSPKTGRAVSREAGAPWHDRLLPLPGFLRGEVGSPSAADIADALRLTRYFLERDVFAPRGLVMPEGRHAVVEALTGRL
ncbi:DNA repair protein RecO [Labrys monachus]|uniref:DNA repair protein RecO n=1 Tax=Labrys monachus TaxID=217067 RepID=A0ABU0FHP8_9HYPH|nr:DNA repair protein RecO [Labrys monachus]MDQ0394133.1 DNA repair protein RecO (recombination protein O) [Labrys monachus]